MKSMQTIKKGKRMRYVVFAKTIFREQRGERERNGEKNKYKKYEK